LRASATLRWIASSSAFGGRISFVSYIAAGMASTTVKITPIIKAVFIGAFGSRSSALHFSAMFSHD
jgi:hypothetical protein